MIRRVDHFVGRLRQVARRTDGFDDIVANEDRGIAKFIARIVERGNGVGVVNEQGGHRNDFARRI